MRSPRRLFFDGERRLLRSYTRHARARQAVLFKNAIFWVVQPSGGKYRDASGPGGVEPRMDGSVRLGQPVSPVLTGRQRIATNVWDDD